MANRKVTADEFADAIMEELKAFSDEVDREMQLAIDEVTNEAYADLSTNPVIPEKSGEYAKGFYIKKEKPRRGYKRNHIANRRYRLTHLLERAHVTGNGGVTRAYPHWENAQRIVDTLPERFKRRITH